MQKRRLGRTGLMLNPIGIGTEHLNNQSTESVAAVIQEAVARGVDYFDVLYTFQDYLDNLGQALAGLRDKVVIALHLGAAETDGQYRRTRDWNECRDLYEEALSRLGIGYADVAVVQYVDDREDLEGVMGRGGLLELAESLKSCGKARFIGISSHEIPIALSAVESGVFDVLMHSVNISWDSAPGRRGLFYECARRDIGLVAMKPYGGGELFSKDPRPTAVQCISYVLSQPGVSIALPGVRTMNELDEALAYYGASAEARNYHHIAAALQQDTKGVCLYCNHCLPCPERIDVAGVLRLGASARRGLSHALCEAYGAYERNASSCADCGECMARCPFGVDVISLMRETASAFAQVKP